MLGNSAPIHNSVNPEDMAAALFCRKNFMDFTDPFTGKSLNPFESGEEHKKTNWITEPKPVQQIEEPQKIDNFVIAPKTEDKKPEAEWLQLLKSYGNQESNIPMNSPYWKLRP